MTRKEITTAQAAELMSCSRQYMMQLIVAGKFPSAHKISDEVNAPYLILESEVLTFQKTRTKPLNKKAE